MSDAINKQRRFVRKSWDLSAPYRKPPPDPCVCKRSLPCIVNRFVLEGKEAPCEACAPHVEKVRTGVTHV